MHVPGFHNQRFRSGLKPGVCFFTRTPSPKVNLIYVSWIKLLKCCLHYCSWLLSLESSVKETLSVSFIIADFFKAMTCVWPLLHCLGVFLFLLLFSGTWTFKVWLGDLTNPFSLGFVRWHHSFQGRPLLKYYQPQLRMPTLTLCISLHFRVRSQKSLD